MSLKSYIEKLESLPFELQRNLQLMRELDVSAESLMKGIETETNFLLKNIEELDDSQRYEKLKEMTESFRLALKQGEDKVSLAAQTYTLTDQAIRKLDDELERFELEELINIKPIKAPKDKTSNRSEKKSSNKTKKDNNKEESAYLKKKKKTQGKDETVKNKAKDKNNSSTLQEIHGDPDEPTYCYCNQVSYGEMVGCDNDTCIREWFHYNCVGLKTQPKGKWYCNDCQTQRRVAGRR